MSLVTNSTGVTWKRAVGAPAMLFEFLVTDAFRLVVKDLSNVQE